MNQEPIRVVLAGGHGRWHLDNLRRLAGAGHVELVGVCDLRPVPPEKFTGAEVTVLVTPIHTHAELAVAALRAGSHLLLEKPPAASLADFEQISAAARDTGFVITVAVTLCASRRHEPYLLVHGGAGQPGRTTSSHARTDLLENLVDHVRTGAFMQVLEAVRCAPEPRMIPVSHQELRHDSAGAVVGRVLPGIAGVTDRSAERLALYSELDVPWAPREQVLRASGRDVASYRWDVDLPRTVSPRPYLHPVCTFGGVEVSEAEPADHVHHLGVGVAIADVDGYNFWGGRSYVPGEGPVWLRDHGFQRHVRFDRRETGGFVEHLEWVGSDGNPILGEERVLAVHALDDACWVLDFSFTLTNLAGTPRVIRSSATKGRAGAGYGGFFWRAPGSAVNRTVFTDQTDGEELINGVRASWVAMSGTAPDGRDWTLVFAQRGSDDPWFVRVREYPGIGPAVAGERPLVLDGSLTRRVVTVVADGRLDRDTAASLVSVRVPRAPRGL